MAATMAAATIPPPVGMPQVVRTSDEELAGYWSEVAALSSATLASGSGIGGGNPSGSGSGNATVITEGGGGSGNGSVSGSGIGHANGAAVIDVDAVPVVDLRSEVSSGVSLLTTSGDASGSAAPSMSIPAAAPAADPILSWSQPRHDHTGLSQGLGGLQVDSTRSGLSQEVGDLCLTPPPGLPAAVAAGPYPNAQPRAPELAVGIDVQMLQHFVNHEVIQHCSIIRSVHGTAEADTLVRYPSTWVDLCSLLEKLAYAPMVSDKWSRLGLAEWDGPAPTAEIIWSRARTCRMICGLADRAQWAEGCRTAAKLASTGMDEAADYCCQHLATVIAARKKSGLVGMALHRELGPQALRLLASTAPPQGEELLTQWSDVMHQKIASGDHILWARDLSALAEKGNAQFWDRVRGHSVILWAPEDNNSFTRLLSHYKKLVDAGQRPQSVRFVMPIRLLPGMSEVARVEDFHWSPLLMQNYRPYVQHTSYTTLPLDMVRPSHTLPQHVRMGLAIYTLGHDCVGAQTVMNNLAAPLLRVAEAKVAVLDLPASDISAFYRQLEAPVFARLLQHLNVQVRDPVRSFISTAEWPRLEVRLVFGSQVADLEMLGLLERLRTSPAGARLWYGLHSIYSAEDAMILEVGDAAAFSDMWKLCTQLVVIGPRRALVYSDAEAKTWTATMDEIMKIDLSASACKVKYKPCKMGGRTVATPTGTKGALGAVSRTVRGGCSPLDFMTIVSVQGETGSEDGQVLSGLMEWTAQHLRLQISAAVDGSRPRAGEFAPMTRPDGSIVPGRLQLLLRDAAEVDRIIGALHGLHLTVGTDIVSVAVTNDTNTAAPIAGNARGGRK